MKQTFKIFVEGDADKRFISQLLEAVFQISINKDCIVKTSGWSNLIAPKTEATYLNQMRMTSANGGTNLVIFDADDDFEKRKKELLSWKANRNADFELFLFPNNSSIGELEDLLEQIINKENQPVMDCWADYEKALKGIELPWKQGEPLTIPAKKTKIYAYLEVLLGTSKSQKEKIKEPNREYTNKHHWDLGADALNKLIDFLKKHLCCHAERSGSIPSSI